MKKHLLALCIAAFSIPSIASAAIVKVTIDSGPFSELYSPPGSTYLDPYIGQHFIGTFTMFLPNEPDIVSMTYFWNPHEITLISKDPLTGQTDYFDVPIWNQSYTLGDYTYGTLNEPNLVDMWGYIDLVNGMPSSYSFSYDGTDSNGNTSWFLTDDSGESYVHFASDTQMLGQMTSSSGSSVTFEYLSQTITSPAAAVPEPSSYAMLSTGLLLAAAGKRRKQ